MSLSDSVNPFHFIFLLIYSKAILLIIRAYFILKGSIWELICITTSPVYEILWLNNQLVSPFVVCHKATNTSLKWVYIFIADLRPHTRWAGRVCRGLCRRMVGDPPSSRTDTPHTPTSPHRAHSRSPQEPETQSLIRWSREGRSLSYYDICLFFAYTTIMSSEAQ